MSMTKFLVLLTILEVIVVAILALLLFGGRLSNFASGAWYLLA